MKFYKVNPESDQVRVFKNGRCVGFLIKNELKTEREIKLIGQFKQSNHFQEVEINKNKTHWFFGARFENQLTC